MPSCVAFGCDLGLKSCSVKRATFSFPGDPGLYAEWVRNLRRQDFVPSVYSRVCEAHFEERFIVRVDRMKLPDGSVLERKRKKLDLTPDAVPSIFPFMLRATTAATATAEKSTKEKVSSEELLEPGSAKGDARTATARARPRRLENFAHLLLVLRESEMVAMMKARGWQALSSGKALNFCRFMRDGVGELFLQTDVEVCSTLETVIRRYEKNGYVITKTSDRTVGVLRTREDLESILVCESEPVTAEEAVLALEYA